MRRLYRGLVVFSLVLAGGLGATAPAHAVLLSVPGYKQCNSAWGSDQLGTCSETICSAGCAITSLSMVFTYFGGSRDPGELNTCLRNNGGYAGGCSVYWSNSCMPSGVSYQGTSGSIATSLANGYPVVAYVTSFRTSMHFVVIVGNNNGQYQINDPGWNFSTLSAGSYTIQGLRFYSGNVSVCQCDPGDPAQVQSCGNCGTRSRRCRSDCLWGAWSACTGQGVCSPGATQSRDCCDCGSQSRTCGTDCEWDGWGDCAGPDPDGGNQVCDTGEPGPCAEGRLRCVEGCLGCARVYEPQPEMCDGVDNDCSGAVDDGFPTELGSPPPPFAARQIDAAYTRRLEPGELSSGWVVYENVGTETWPAGAIWLASGTASSSTPSPFHDPDTWPAYDVLAVNSHAVAPGQTVDMTFTLDAPDDLDREISETFTLLTPAGEAIACPSPILQVSAGPIRAEENTTVNGAPGDDDAGPGAGQGGCRTGENGGGLALLGLALLGWVALRRRRG